MKYLKYYKLFESIENRNLDPDLFDKVSEVFYPISDKGLDIRISRESSINDGVVTKKIAVSIRVDSGRIFFDYKDIKEDLEFAVNYLTKELKLKMDEIHHYLASDGETIWISNLAEIDKKSKDIEIIRMTLYFINNL